MEEPRRARTRLLSGKLVVLGAGEVVSRGLTFLAMAYLFRVLGREAFGYLEKALAVLMFCSLGMDLGLSVIGAREVARTPGSAAGLVGRVVSIQLLLALVMAGLWLGSAWLVPMPAVQRHLFTGLSVSLLFLPLSLHWVFQGRDQAYWFALPRAARYVVFCAGAFLLVRTPEDLSRLPLAEILAVACMGALLVAGFLRGGERFRLDLLRPDWSLLRTALPVGGSNLLWALRMYLSHLLIAGFAGEAALGIFGAAHRVLMVYQGGLDVYFTRLFPAMSQAAQESRAALGSLLRRSTHLLLWPTLLLASGISWYAREIMATLYSQEGAGEDGGVLLVFLIWLAPVLALRRHGRFALISLNHSRPELICSLAGVASLVLLLIPATTRHGAVGAAFAMLVSEMLATTLTGLVLLQALRRKEAR